MSRQARPPAPVLSVKGLTLDWVAIPGASEYEVSAKGDGRTSYITTAATSLTPAGPSGQTVRYKVRVLNPDKGDWSAPVSITYPRSVIFGINFGSTWGAADASQFIARGLTSDRVEAPGTQGNPGSSAAVLKQSEAYGYADDDVIVGNIQDSVPLSAVNIATWTSETLKQVKEAAANGATLLEVGNEMYAKGPGKRCGHCTEDAEPARYAEMFVSLSKAAEAAGVSGVELLFDSFGSYEEGPGGPWSKACCGGGWLATAVKAEPELLTRVDGFTMHPYGEPGTNLKDDRGPGALDAEHQQALALGFRNTQYYVTEYGVAIRGKITASALARQATQITAAYTEMLGFGFVSGIWYFETHDDVTGNWGLVEPQSSEASPFVPRPALAAVSQFALGGY